MIQTLKSADAHSIVLSKESAGRSIKTAFKSNIISCKDIMCCELIDDGIGKKKLHKYYS